MTNFIPIFPLNIVLYPGETLNLHIFEPRYKELVKECFSNKKPFGIPAVINGASDLMVAVLGDAGRHARAAVGVAVLPLNCCVEVEATFEVA